MKERGWGRIVNMASVAGTLGGFGQASYSTTKAGALGLTRTLAMEGARHGITCNAIVPGVIGTEAFHMANAAMNERIVARTVFKRPGEPQDIANAIAFLCSDLAAYITGVGLYVSGGIELFVFWPLATGHPGPPPAADPNRKMRACVCRAGDEIVTVGSRCPRVVTQPRFSLRGGRIRGPCVPSRPSRDRVCAGGLVAVRWR